jgi:hypothetical protein
MQIITVATVALIIFLLIRNNNVYEFRIGLINDFYKVDKGFFWERKNEDIGEEINYKSGLKTYEKTLEKALFESLKLI